MNKYIREAIQMWKGEIAELNTAFQVHLRNKRNASVLHLIIEDHVPRASKRPRFIRRGKFVQVYVPDADKNKKYIQSIIKKQLPIDFEKIECCIDIQCKYYLPIPKSKSKIKKIFMELGIIRPVTKPDLDNLDKTYYDANNKFLWIDDSHIVSSHSYKYYSSHPRVEIRIKWW